MIDRTTFDLRIAEHRSTTARAEQRAWQSQGATPAGATRAALANALLRLAARLDPALELPRRGAASPAPSGAA